MNSLHIWLHLPESLFQVNTFLMYLRKIMWKYVNTSNKLFTFITDYYIIL